MIRVVPDCSFLSHATIPQQQTDSAVAALLAAGQLRHEFVVPSAVLTEFLSLLRKLVTRRTMTPTTADGMMDFVMKLVVSRVEPSDAVLGRAWSIAATLGQSDVFDALGYAVAEEIGAEFWTSDLRFHNAAAGAGLSGIRFVA